MTPIDVTARVQEYHQTYCEETGMQLGLRFDRERAWLEFMHAGFGVDDLRLVARHLRRMVERGERNPGCLKFINLVQRLDAFEEELALAKAYMRNFKVTTPKDKAMSEMRPVVCEPPAKNTARPAKELVRNAIEQMKRAVG